MEIEKHKVLIFFVLGLIAGWWIFGGKTPITVNVEYSCEEPVQVKKWDKR